jgi:hypothetical protein
VRYGLANFDEDTAGAALFMNYQAQRQRFLMVPQLLLRRWFFLGGGLLLCRSPTSAVSAAWITTGCSEKYG